LISLKQELTDFLSQESDRDKQRLVGPSSLGGCAYCLGLDMLGEKEQDFGWYPRLGTAFHYWAEHHQTIPGAMTERKVTVGEIPGYGILRGTMDLYLPHRLCIVDYKLVGKGTRQAAMLDGPSTQYRVQQHLYCKGAIAEGLDVKGFAIAYLPRDSHTLRDMHVHEEAYDPRIAQKALDRAEQVWKYSSSGRVEELPSSTECYTCDRNGRAPID
jgi:hypothetical protein